jgi:GR25 family glycosyltransferase involved in LPS biosynthesis
MIIIIIIIIIFLILFIKNNSKFGENNNECEIISIDKFFLISMRDSVERRNTFLKSFERLKFNNNNTNNKDNNNKIPLEIIWGKNTKIREEAEKYSHLVKSEYYKNIFEYDSDKIIRPDHTYFNSGAIGCYLAHLDFYNSSISQKLNYTLVFEDNIILSSDFPADLNNALKRLGNDFDACFLHCWDSIISEKVVKCNNEKINKLKWLSSTKCYLINVNRFKKYVPLLLPMETHIDITFEKLIHKGADIYSIKLNSISIQPGGSVIGHSKVLDNNKFRYLHKSELKNIVPC